jgi:predicted GNAT family N-acyltransferase
VEALDTYIQRQASQDLQRKVAAIFILTGDGKNIAGFYSLSAHSIQAEDLPRHLAKKLPRFPLPATLLGRMAVSEKLQGQGLGEFLLMDALRKAWLGSKQIASLAVTVDAKENAVAFYLKFGFIPTITRPGRMFYPMATIERLFAEPAGPLRNICRSCPSDVSLG